MTKTYNRGKLRREILKGEMRVKRDYKYTDDYACDDAYDYYKTSFMTPTVIEHRTTSAVPNSMDFHPEDFRGTGSAWEDDDGTICLYQGFQSFTFKRVTN